MQVYGFGDVDCPAALVHAPIAVLPSPFPRSSFEKARQAMHLFNTVTDRITRDKDYLTRTLSSAAALDSFTVRFQPYAPVETVERNTVKAYLLNACVVG